MEDTFNKFYQPSGNRKTSTTTNIITTNTDGLSGEYLDDGEDNTRRNRTERREAR